MSHKFGCVESAISWAAGSSQLRAQNIFKPSRERGGPKYETTYTIDDVFLCITKAWRNGSLPRSDLEFMGRTIKCDGKNLQTDGHYSRWQRCLEIVKPYFVERGIIEEDPHWING